jgi:uncharacterized protein (DUF1697 family)
MAARSVALLRGINVGKAKRVAMADLRALFEGLGYTEVATLLNSGNVVFGGARGQPAATARKLEQAIETSFGFTSRVTIVSGADLARVLAENPLSDVADDPSRLMIGFPQDATALKGLRELARQDWGRERLALGPRALYVWCPKGVIDSAPMKVLQKQLGEAWTARNRATVEKLAELAAR